jgi:hypothetical protein
MTVFIATIFGIGFVEWYAEVERRSGPASYVALGAWAAGLAVARFCTRRPRVRPAQPYPCSRSEPPAVAALLVNRWRVPAAAVAATALDLVHRRVLSLQTVEEIPWVRAHRTPGPGELTPYEQRVYDRIRHRAQGRGVELAAVDRVDDPDDRGTPWGRWFDPWLSGFRDDVRADAYARGVARRRYPRGFLRAALLLACVPPAVAVLTCHDLPAMGPRTSDTETLVLLLIITVVLTLLLSGLGGARATADGLSAARDWAGTLAYLRADAQLVLRPLTGAESDRTLAYAMAFGLILIPEQEPDEVALKGDRPVWSASIARFRNWRARSRGSAAGG